MEPAKLAQMRIYHQTSNAQPCADRARGFLAYNAMLGEAQIVTYPYWLLQTGRRAMPLDSSPCGRSSQPRKCRRRPDQDRAGVYAHTLRGGWAAQMTDSQRIQSCLEVPCLQCKLCRVRPAGLPREVGGHICAECSTEAKENITKALTRKRESSTRERRSQIKSRDPVYHQTPGM